MKLLLSIMLAFITAAPCMAVDVTADYVTYSCSGTTATVTGLSDATYTGTVTIPATVTDGATTYNVTEIVHDAFPNKSITGLDLSGATNLVTIGNGAFYGCGHLTGSLVLPAHVTLIDNFAFDYAGFTSVDMTAATGLLTIGQQAFYQTSELTDLKMPNSVTTIGNSAFQWSGISSVTLPANLQTIGTLAFANCESLKCNITIGGNVTGIGNSAFKGSAITGMDLSGAASLTWIGGEAFSDCKSLTGTISIPVTVNSLGGNFVTGCTLLTALTVATDNTAYQSVDGVVFSKDAATLVICIPSKSSSYVIPAGVKTIFEGAFSGSKITGVDFTQATQLTTIPKSVFNRCTALTGTLKIPAQITEVYDSAFQATAITALDMTDATALEYIDQYAFADCTQLAGEINMPSSVAVIGDYAFSKCALARAFFTRDTPPQIYAGTFADCNNLKIYVKDGRYTYDYYYSEGNKYALTQAYKDKDGWTTSAYLYTYPYQTKTITAAGQGTLYLPYDVPIPTGVTAYYCSNNNGDGTIRMTQLTEGTIPACTPVYLKAEAGEYRFLANGDNTTQSGKAEILKGTSTAMQNGGNVYLTYGLKDGTTDTYGFFLNTTTNDILANTCYIIKTDVVAEAKSITLSFDDTPTAISNVQTAPEGSGMQTVYDLQGRRVQNPDKGIYIVNGKKKIY